jgi:hypothetical protein
MYHCCRHIHVARESYRFVEQVCVSFLSRGVSVVRNYRHWIEGLVAHETTLWDDKLEALWRIISPIGAWYFRIER